jgi:hypothetical protein
MGLEPSRIASMRPSTCLLYSIGQSALPRLFGHSRGVPLLPADADADETSRLATDSCRLRLPSFFSPTRLGTPLCWPPLSVSHPLGTHLRLRHSRARFRLLVLF